MSDNHLRIIHVISGDLFAGAETMALSLLADQHHDAGMTVSVITLNNGALSERLRTRGIKVHIVDETQYSSLTIFTKILGVLRNIRPHVVHTHRLKENILGGFAAKLIGARSIRTTHGWSEFEESDLSFRKRLARRVDGWVCDHIQDRQIAVSEELREKLSRGRDAQKLRTIENGIDIEQTYEFAKLCTEFQVDANQINVGIVARLVPVKRHDKLIDAAHILDQQDRECYQFHVIGDGPLAAELAFTVSTLNLQNVVRFHGHVGNAVAAIAKLDVVVVCSDHEGLPMNVLECLVVGTPVVSVPIPSICALIGNSQDGLIATGDKPADIATAISSAPEKLTDNSSRKDSSWRYSSARMAEKYKSVYGDVLDRE